jgi:hypothetical protein
MSQTAPCGGLEVPKVLTVLTVIGSITITGATPAQIAAIRKALKSLETKEARGTSLDSPRSGRGGKASSSGLVSAPPPGILSLPRDLLGVISCMVPEWYPRLTQTCKAARSIPILSATIHKSLNPSLLVRLCHLEKVRISVRAGRLEKLLEALPQKSLRNLVIDLTDTIRWGTPPIMFTSAMVKALPRGLTRLEITTRRCHFTVPYKEIVPLLPPNLRELEWYPISLPTGPGDLPASLTSYAMRDISCFPALPEGLSDLTAYDIHFGYLDRLSTRATGDPEDYYTDHVLPRNLTRLSLIGGKVRDPITTFGKTYQTLVDFSFTTSRNIDMVQVIGRMPNLTRLNAEFTSYTIQNELIDNFIKALPKGLLYLRLSANTTDYVLKDLPTGIQSLSVETRPSSYMIGISRIEYPPTLRRLYLRLGTEFQVPEMLESLPRTLVEFDAELTSAPSAEQFDAAPEGIHSHLRAKYPYL